MNRTRFPFDIVILSLFLIAVAVGLWWWFRPPRNDQYNAPAAQYYKDLEQRYAEDTFGGNTPEETLQLFIAALESGNIDLASKYFVIEKQGEKKEDFSLGKQNGSLNQFLILVKKAKNSEKLLGDRSQFVIINENNEALMSIDLIKIPNGKWKISSL